MPQRSILLLTLTIASVGIASLTTSYASASTVTLQISGVVEEVMDGVLSPPVVVGMPFTAIAVYDLGAADLYSDSPNQGRFEQAPGVSSITINVNGMIFQSNGLLPTDIQIWNNLPIDGHFPESPTPLGDLVYLNWSGLTSPYPYDSTFVDLILGDHSATAISNDQLPASIDLAAYDIRKLNILGINELAQPGYQAMTYLQMRPTSINVVPEPSTSGLVLTAIMAFAAIPLRRILWTRSCLVGTFLHIRWLAVVALLLMSSPKSASAGQLDLSVNLPDIRTGTIAPMSDEPIDLGNITSNGANWRPYVRPTMPFDLDHDFKGYPPFSEAPFSPAQASLTLAENVPLTLVIPGLSWAPTAFTLDVTHSIEGFQITVNTHAFIGDAVRATIVGPSEYLLPLGPLAAGHYRLDLTESAASSYGPIPYGNIRADSSFETGNGSRGFVEFDVLAVPEPCTVALLATGLGCLLVRRIRRNRALLVVVSVLACCCVLSRPASAAQVMLQFTGVVEQVSDASGLLHAPIPVGTQFTALIQYETGVPDFLSEWSELGYYSQPPGAARMAIDVGGYHFESLIGGNIGVETKNNAQLGWTEWGIAGPPGDQFSVSAELSNPFPLSQFNGTLLLADSSAQAMSSDAVPLSVGLSDFDIRWISIYGEAKVGHENYPTSLEVRLRPTAVAVVPEPASDVLMGVGAVLLGWVSRRVPKKSHTPNGVLDSGRTARRNCSVPLVATVIIFAIAFPGAAAAAPVMLQINGVVEEVTDTAGVFLPPAVAGTPFTALLVYDSSVNDVLPDDEHRGSYVQSTSASLSIDIAGQTFATAATAGFGIKVSDNDSEVLLQGDSLSFTASDVIFPITFNNMSISMFLRDSTGAALPSDALPAGIDASAFGERWIDISGFSASVPSVGPGSLGIRLRPDSFTVVPEPCTVALLATGVGSLIVPSLRLAQCSTRRRRQYGRRRPETSSLR